MKKLMTLALTFVLLAQLLTGCNAKNSEDYSQYSKYSDSFFDSFDTMTQIVAYTKSEDEFNAYVEQIHDRFRELHRLYDIYNDYEGINNIKTINDNAGIKPIKVDRDIIELIKFGKEWHDITEGQTNMAMGAVFKIWHDYREAGKFDPENAKLPPMELLQEASKHADIDKVIVDEENSTVFLEDPKMRLDVGAIAKGYATEIVVREIMDAGMTSGIISAGGNVRVLGKPLDGIRDRWGVGIQNPEKAIFADDESSLLDIIFLNNASVVSSGDYQRYYIVDDKVIHHLIDPKTLMPGEYYRAVTIMTEDSGIADAMSTAAFLLPYDKSRKLVESLDGVEAVWVFKDGKVEATKGMQKIMKSQGATGAKAK